MNASSQTHAQTGDRVKSLYVTFAWLMILLVATIGLSFVDLGAAHTSVGIGIAVVKTLLVAGVFMNLLTSSNTVRLCSVSALLWMAFFVLIVMGDYLTRGWDETQQPNLRLGDHYTSFDKVEYTPPIEKSPDDSGTSHEAAAAE